MDQLLITNADKIIWACIKAIFISMMMYFFFTSVLSYPNFPETDGFFINCFNWLYSLISENWAKLMLVLIFFYSWATYRATKIIARRSEQLEVIAFSQIRYLNYMPATDISRVTSGQELIKSIILGWFLSWFGIDNPKDLPWSAVASKGGDVRTSLKDDIQCDFDDEKILERNQERWKAEKESKLCQEKIERDLKCKIDLPEVKKLLDNPIPAEKYCQKYNVDMYKLNKFVQCGKLKGHSYNGELYVSDFFPSDTDD